MAASPLDFLRGGPPAPRTALLADAVFFSRAVPVPATATRAEVAAQVGLALEALSPFPLAQLYHGYYWIPGADRALAFAAYRRRFTAEQAAAWSGVEHVLPAFAALLGANPGPGTAAVLSSAEGLTVIAWDRGPVPATVLHHVLARDASEEDRDRARRSLLAAAGPAARAVDVPSPPRPLPTRDDRELAFEAGELRSLFPADAAAGLDVRDKADLQALARARRRDVLIWRVALGALAACVLFAVGEAVLFGAGLWQQRRNALVAAQRPTVARIMDEQELAARIDELSTKRLLPLEMISLVAPESAMPKNPPPIQFLRATTSALNSIQIEAQTNNPGSIAGYKSALEQTAGVDRVEIRDQRGRDNIVTFILIVTFKPGALSPAAS